MGAQTAANVFDKNEKDITDNKATVVDVSESSSSSSGTGNDGSQHRPICHIESLDCLLESYRAARSEAWVANAMNQIQIYTLLGSIYPIVLAMRSVAILDFSSAVVFLMVSFALIFCCIHGNRKKDWRFIFGVFVIALLLAAYSITRCFFIAISSVNRSYLSDEAVVVLGYGSRGVMIAFDILQCVCAACAAVYWALAAYSNEKIIHLLMTGYHGTTRSKTTCRRRRRQQQPQQPPCESKQQNKESDIDRDLTRADTAADISFVNQGSRIEVAAKTFDIEAGQPDTRTLPRSSKKN